MTTLVEDVFTPSSRAKINFVPRPEVNDPLVDALRTPGMQVVVYGESGSGKTTLLAKKLEELYPGHVTTRCTVSSTWESVLLDAFDRLSPYYESAATVTHAAGVDASVTSTFASISASRSASATSTTTRALPPQLTVSNLARLLGAAGLCWVLEDFHKVPEEHRAVLSQSLKVFMDMSDEYREVKVIAIGAAESARQIVEYDQEMRHRVTELHVEMMTREQIAEIIRNGGRLLNLDFDAVEQRIVTLSNGAAAVCHQLCLNLCREHGIDQALATSVRFDAADLEPAIKRYVREASDSLRARFDRALNRQRVRKYDNCRLILSALGNAPLDGLRQGQLLRAIREEVPDYPPANLTLYLRELIGQKRGSILRLGSNQQYRFRDPLHHTYAQLSLGSTRRVDANFEAIVNSIAEILRSRADASEALPPTPEAGHN